MSNFTAEGLLSIFPHSLKVSPDYWNLAQAIAPELERLYNAAVQCEILCRVDELPEETLDALAVDLDVFWWKPDATLAEKRLGIKQALAGHRQLGTVQAVQNAIDTFLGGGVLQEWFEYDGEPFHFRILCADNEEIAANYPVFLKVLGGVKRWSAVMDPLEDSYLLDELNNDLTDEEAQPLLS